MWGRRNLAASLLSGALVGLLVTACTAEPSPTPVPTEVAPTPTTLSAPPATPTPLPTATPVPSATTQPASPTATSVPASPPPTPTQVSAVQSGTVYHNTLYGFSVAYPEGWTVQENTAPTQETPASVAATFTIPQATDLEGKAFIFYYPEPLKPSEIAEQELSALAAFPAFRSISSSDFTLADGTEAHQVLYGFGVGQDEQRGALVLAARGTQVPILQIAGPRTLFERNLDQINGFLDSLQMEEPAPFGVKRSQSLVLSLDSGPITLDPAIAQESRSIQYIGQVFSGLAALDKDLKVVPDLATWTVSADGKVYTFTINEKAKFHDGRAVTANDVVYSWERAALPATKSPTARTYLGDIVGIADVLDGKAEHASGLKVVSDRVLEVTIDAPKVYFLSKLTHTSAAIVDETNVKTGEDWWQKPNGTGPFRLKEWYPQVAMHLERNDAYYATPAKVPHIIYRLYAGFPVRMFEDGEVDAAFLSLQEVQALQEEKSPLAAQITSQPQLSITFIGFDTSKPPFDDPLVRRAFLLAVDRKAIVEETLAGVGTLAQGFLPPGLPGYDAGIRAIPYSPAEAKALLAQSKYPTPADLGEIVITTSGDIGPHLVRMAQMWQDNLGVQLKAKILPTGAYYYNLTGQLQGMYDYGWVADYPDPHNFLDVLFHTGADNNIGKFSNTDIDSLLEQARVETDEAKRTDLYRQVERIVVDQAAGIPLWFGQDRVLVKPYLEGFRVDSQGQVDLSAVTVKEQR